MTHNNIWKIFKEKIPFYADNAETWFPCGRGAIRIRMKTKEEYVFSVSDDGSWMLETIKHYMKSMKGDKRM